MGRKIGIVWLIIAIVFEVIATTNVKLAAGFTNTWNTALVFIGMLGAIYFLSKALVYIPLAIAYAIWVGAGTGIVALIGVIVFDEAFGPVRITGLIFIIAGVWAMSLFLNEKETNQGLQVEKEF
ncbi:DMT family transporter [Natribacillus halophilus]|uniref:Small multidrug resistance pump n=1 Tax=Natribacillus halophilus TaxID=549003 RepID=A0A1G8PII5_9BACI|nr:multidrug efflux SMR transporter [Natribacillus halophilus]SDI92128.1 small multidrug resistance pump [Natribacillus halophilus]